MNQLVISGLRVAVGDKEILKGIDLTISSGEVHAVMGPNGSGKSTLAHALANRPGYRVLDGTVTLDGADVLGMSTTERARAGLFLAMQHPLEVPGVRTDQMLVAGGVDPQSVSRLIAEESVRVGLKPELLERFINVDLSGGERKRAEIVQLVVRRPKIAVLDEIDSGLDVDALHDVAVRLTNAVSEIGCGVLAITHFQRLLNVLHPTHVHVMSDGRIVRSGGAEIAGELEISGYEPFRSTIS